MPGTARISVVCIALCLPAGVSHAQSPRAGEELTQGQPAPSSSESVATAKSEELSLEHHLWGRFCPGAWKLVRVTTEVLDAQGQVTDSSVFETKTTLIEVSDSEVTLRMEVAIEVAGKRIQREPEIVRQGTHGELLVQGMQVKHVGAGSVTLEGVEVPCEIEQVDVTGSSTRSVTRLFFSTRQMPYLLRRESVTTDLEGQKTLNRAETEVLATELPYVAVDQTVPAAVVRTVHQHAGGTIVTLAITSPEVPGGVITQSSKETDARGTVIRRSTLEVVDYDYRTEEEERGILGRRRALRTRKPLFRPAEPRP